MLTTQEFDQLQEGDVIETVPMFPALSQTDVVKLLVKAKTDDAAEFIATYFGVTLGKWTCTRKDGKLAWGFAK
jgi:hypothetical protein